MNFEQQPLLIGVPSVARRRWRAFVIVSVIASLIARALRDRDDAEALGVVRKEVADLCARFPVY